MQNQLNELKRKMLEFFQQKQKNKKLASPGKKGSSVQKSKSLEKPAIFPAILLSIKALFNLLFVLGFLGGMLGAGIALGYGVALFDKVRVPQTEELVHQVRDISSISEITYADGTVIASIESDLLRTSISSEQISENLKKAIIATEDEHFKEHKGVVPKAVIRATLGKFVGLGSSSGGSTLTQQLIKQQVVGDAPTLARKATEIVDALALERVMNKDEILTTYLNVAPFGRNNRGRILQELSRQLRGFSV